MVPQELADGGARELQPYTQREPDKVPIRAAQGACCKEHRRCLSNGSLECSTDGRGYTSKLE